MEFVTHQGTSKYRVAVKDGHLLLSFTSIHGDVSADIEMRLVDMRLSLQEFLTTRQKFTGTNTTILLRKETKFVYITG